MPRISRIFAENAYYYVITRDNQKQAVFSWSNYRKITFGAAIGGESWEIRISFLISLTFSGWRRIGTGLGLEMKTSLFFLSTLIWSSYRRRVLGNKNILLGKL